MPGSLRFAGRAGRLLKKTCRKSLLQTAQKLYHLSQSGSWKHDEKGTQHRAQGLKSATVLATVTSECCYIAPLSAT